MAFVVKDRCAGLSITEGVGSYAVASTPTGYQSLSNIGNTNTFPGRVTDGINWEVGIYTLTTGPLTVARTTILDSSNAGAAVNWGPGTREIACSLPAARAPLLNADNTFTGVNTFGVLNATGAFTSLGIDDNATQEVLQLSDGNAILGPAAGNYSLLSKDDTAILTVSGGATGNSGANIQLMGSTHATLAGDFRLRQDTDQIILWDASANNLALASAAGDTLTINAETVSQPNIPCFLAYNSATDANQTGNAAGVTVDVDTEVFDQSADFAADTFTAPAAGKYLLHAQVSFADLTTAMNQFNIFLNTSNRTYTMTNFIHVEAAADVVTLHITAIADMDAADTAFVQAQILGGAGNTADISSIGAPPTTYFCGMRVA